MKPFLSGKRLHDAAALRSLSVAKPVPPPHRETTGNEGPSVDVVKEGDKVVRIVITCSCGEKVEVDCLYPAGS
jgi:hypothetical protein